MRLRIDNELDSTFRSCDERPDLIAQNARLVHFTREKSVLMPSFQTLQGDQDLSTRT
jgi:hypothetical protein